MSVSETPHADSAIGGSSVETRRAHVRALVIGMVVCLVAFIVAGMIAPVSDRLQEVCDAEVKLIPEWQYWTGMAAAVGLLVCALYGLCRLWAFKSDGTGYLAFAVLFPMFLWLPLSSATSAFGDYVDSISNIVLGMLLFAAWSNPDIFDPATESQSTPTSETTSPARPMAS